MQSLHACSHDQDNLQLSFQVKSLAPMQTSVGTWVTEKEKGNLHNCLPTKPPQQLESVTYRRRGDWASSVWDSRIKALSRGWKDVTERPDISFLCFD